MIVGGAITLHEALAAYQTLKAEGHNVRVVDLFSVKPVDKDGLIKNARECGSKVLTVEEHYPEGGIFELVSSAVVTSGIQVHRLSVERIPGSAKPNEQLAIHHIDRTAIIAKAKEILGGS